MSASIATGVCPNPDCNRADVKPVLDPYFDAEVWVCPGCKSEVDDASQ